MDQEQAIRAAQRGREPGYAWLFERYRAPLYRFVRRHRDLDAETANDVLQATFIRAFRSLSELREVERFEPWLLRIARRESLRALGRRRGHEPLDEELDQACDREERAAEQLERERLMEQIRDLAPRVGPPAVRDTAVRYYLGDPPCTTDELAAELGVPPATVRKRLFSFRNKLRERLRGEGVFST